MYFNDEHQLFRESIKAFIAKEVIPNAETWEAERHIPKEILKKMGDMGYLGLLFPEEYGGNKADFWFSVVFLEEITRSFMGGFSTMVSVHTYMAINHIFKAGSEELKQKYLVPAIAGQKLAALGITEPDAGSDVAAIRTTARKEGNEYIINGSKTFISNGYYGDFITLTCKTDLNAGAAGISLIVVDLAVEGITKTKLNKMGWHSSDTAEIKFDDVRVPVSNLIGQENGGFYYLMESLQIERLVAAIMAVAQAELALEETLRYLHEREAFGKKIAKFQAIRHKIAEIATEIEISKHFVYNVCKLFSEGKIVVKECSMAKLHASELAKRVIDTCLQFFGGYGYIEDYPICRMYRDVRVGTIAGGTSEIMKEIIAKIVIDEVKYGKVY